MASGVTHIRTTEQVDTYHAGRDYYGLHIPWCRKKPTRNEKDRRQCENTYVLLYAMFAMASGVTHMRTEKVRRQCENTYGLLYALFAMASGVTHTGTTERVDTYQAGRDYYGLNIPWCR